MDSRGVPMPDLPGVEHRWVRAGEVELHLSEAVPTHVRALLAQP